MRRSMSPPCWLSSPNSFKKIGRNPCQHHAQVIENRPGEQKSARREDAPTGGDKSPRGRRFVRHAIGTDHAAHMLDHAFAAEESRALGTAGHGFARGMPPAPLLD